MRAALPRLLFPAIALALALTTAAPRAALAAPGDKERAAEHFSLAEAAERRGDWETAILEYKRAYALAPHPSVLYNIAVDYEKLGDLDNAAAYYRRYLDGTPGAEDRAEVEAKIADLERRARQRRTIAPGAAPGRLVVHANVDGAQVFVDGAPVGVTPVTVDLPAGPHQVELRLAGHAPASRHVEIAPGGSEEIREFLAPQGGGGTPAGEPLPPRFGLVLGYGLGVVETTSRFRFGVALRLSRALDFGVHLGLLGKNDVGVGADARLMFGNRGVRPYARLAGSIGRASLGTSTYTTYGGELGAGVVWAPVYGGGATGVPRIGLEYYGEVNARVTGGGIDGDVMGATEVDKTTPFQVALDFGLAYRF